MRIPFSRSAVVGREREYLSEAISSGALAGDGDFTKRCHQRLAERLGVARALLTTSCTHALEMCALLLDIEPGDEVIVPSFTFVSTVNAFVLRGARPVFIDCRPDTLNLDERLLGGLITDRTRVILAMHYAGVACEMDSIMAVAEARDIAVVEDNAHGLFGKYRGRWLGTFGALAAQSFHSTKNFSCGEGGALLVNDPKLVERAEIIREKGTNRSRFLRGDVDRYTWVDVGSSYLPSELLAAFLLGQLESETTIQDRRRRVWQTYHRELSGWAAQHGIGTPHCPPECEQSWHLYYLMLPSLEDRTDLIRYLGERGIIAPFHYQALHLSEMGKQFRTDSDLPVTEAATDRLMRLPLYNDMSDSDVDEVLEALHAWR